MSNIKQEFKRQFQLERIIFFSDAVFAIAITLLIIELHLPDVTIQTNGDLLKALGTILPDVFGFVISFFIIASFWNHHHSIFGYVKNFDSALIWLNLLTLFFIVLIPFTTTLLGAHGNLLASTTIYTVNILGVGIMFFLILRHISKKGEILSQGLANKKFRKGLYLFSLTIPAWILICWFIGLVTAPGIGDFFLFGLSFVIPFSKKKFLSGRNVR